MKTAKEVIDYLMWCRENGVTAPRLKGYFPFQVLLELGWIAPHYTTLRIMYTGLCDIFYGVNQDGLLEQVGVENPTPVDPKDVLSEEKNPAGWEPERLVPPKTKNKARKKED